MKNVESYSSQFGILLHFQPYNECIIQKDEIILCLWWS